MDLGGVAVWVGMPVERQQTTTALYYLMYKPVLSYALPFCLLTAPLVKMGKLVNTTMDDHGQHNSHHHNHHQLWSYGLQGGGDGQ